MKELQNNLNQHLNFSDIKSRKQSGQNLQYIEGYVVETNANRIFNYKWTKEILKKELLYKREYTSKTNKEMIEVAYTHEVRIHIPELGIFRDGTGFGNGQASISNPSAAYELALKESDTDAEKRAFKTLGEQFGLGLYDKELTQSQAQKRYDNGIKLDVEFENFVELIHDCKTVRELKEIKNKYNGVYNKQLNEEITKQMKVINNENT